MRKRLLGAAAIALALVAGACGGDDGGSDDAAATKDGDTATTAAKKDDATATTAAAGGGGGSVELRWRTRPDNKAEADVYQSVSDDLTSKSKVYKLKYEPGGTESSNYQDQLKTEIANGTAPDVFWIPGTDIADFANAGLILDLKPQADKDKDFKATDFYAEPMAHLQFDPATSKSGGKLWGLPRDVSTFALYLNLDLITQAKAEDPRALAKAGKWDWAAFAKVAEQVTATGGANRGFAMNAWWANYGFFLNAAGGGFFNADRTACGLDSAGSIAGLTQAKAIYDKKLAVPYGEDGEKPWKAGTVGMFVNGRWATPGAREVKFNWDVVELPKGPGGSQGNWLFWGAYVVNAKTKSPEAAYQLVRDLTTAETQAKVSALGANIPSRKSDAAIKAFLGFSPPANNQAFINALNDKPVAEGPLWAGSWPAYDKAMNAGVEAVLKNTRTIDDFKANICKEVAGAFKK